ncbi:lipoprotein [Lysobacter enzymogenes]|uniref:Lipoprotein n=1 Tax=Lysobacter enzymogenes TaxID=69 RepID=A0A0S2DFZ4_LYSEN|nr:lipoprotein [Lysobacter enzymogenes]
MRTDPARTAATALRAAALLSAGAAMALAAACSRPGAGATNETAAAAKCEIPQWLQPPHGDGFCDLPADLRGFVAEYEEFKAFSGGEPSDAAAMEALAREHERRVGEQRARWSRLRARYAADTAVSRWIQRYGQEQDRFL